MKSPHYMFVTACAFVVAIAMLFAATGCKNTAKGFGKDVENTGEKIQKKMD